jgi:DNA-binding MarR family transcriptional regulator
VKDELSAFRLFTEIGIIAQLATTKFEAVMPDGMTIAQFSILNHFVRLGGERSPNELARAFQVTKGTMTSTLQRLDARGCITIRPDPHDGRGKLVSITPEGVKVREAAIHALRPFFAKLSTHSIASSFPQLLEQLGLLRQFVDNERADD